MPELVTLAVAAKGALEAVAAEGGALSGLKTVALDGVRAGASEVGSFVERLANDAGWSAHALMRTADGVVGPPAGGVSVEAHTLPAEVASRAEALGEGEAPNRQAELFGVEAAKHHLEQKGCTAIVELGGGGPGGAMPDVIALGPDGRLQIAEAKGTLVGTKLQDAGLARNDPATGDTRWENSPEWLRASGEKVLETLDAKLAENPDPELQKLRDVYAEHVENGFDDPQAYDNIVVQAGHDLHRLDPGNLPPTIQQFVAEAHVDEIVQYSTERP